MSEEKKHFLESVGDEIAGLTIIFTGCIFFLAEAIVMPFFGLVPRDLMQVYTITSGLVGVGLAVWGVQKASG